MWLMLQQDEPDDYVIATGVQYSVREFVERAAPYFGINIVWEGEGLDEVGYVLLPSVYAEMTFAEDVSLQGEQ